MSTLSIRLPESLHDAIKKISKKDKISINQFINSAINEKVTALGTASLIQEKAEKGDLDAFLNALKMVPDVEPDEQDT
jgi:predicted DNA-binding ribbon-helix-helix protein